MTQTQCAERVELRGFQVVAGAAASTGPRPVHPLAVAAVAESAEAVIEGLDAPVAAASAILEREGTTSGSEPGPSGPAVPHRVASPHHVARPAPTTRSDDRPVALDEYAKAVLYNGLGHYQAAHAAARRACQHDDFILVEGALSELVEAAVRTGNRQSAVAALRQLEARAQASGSEWAMGMAACSRALLEDDEAAEARYLEALQLLASVRARVALARARLLYGEWLRRRGRRIDARHHLTLAHSAFSDVGMGGYAERAHRELLATGRTVRKRTDDTRLDLTAQETQIAQLAADGSTNPEIGQRLFISPRTVEWHLSKVFTKLGVTSRRELRAAVPRGDQIIAAT